MTRNQWLVLVSAVLLAGIAGLSAWAIGGSPARVVTQSLRQLADADSVWGAATVATFAPVTTAGVAGADPIVTSVPVVVVGQGGVNMPKTGRPSGTVTFSLVSGKEKADDTMVEIRARQDGTAFVDMTQAPASGPTAAGLKELQGKWFTVPAAQLAGLVSKAAAPYVPAADATRDEAAVDAAWKHLRTVATGGDLFGDPVSQGTAFIGDLPSRKYSVPLLPDGMRLVAEDLAVIIAGRPLSGAEKDQIAQDSAHRAGTVDLWIDRPTKRILQANIDLRGIDDAASTADKVSASYLSVLLRITGWNEPVAVDAPEGAEPIDALVRQIRP